MTIQPRFKAIQQNAIRSTILPFGIFCMVMLWFSCSSESFTPEHLSGAGNLYESLTETFDRDIACGDLGYDAELKIKKYRFKHDPSPHAYVTQAWVNGKPYAFEITAATDGYVLSYNTEYKVYAAIVEGKSQANVFYYPNSTTSDDTLQAPDDEKENRSPIQRLSLCLNFNLTVENSAVGSVDQTYAWYLSKSVSHPDLQLSEGQKHAVKYTIEATKTLEQEKIAMAGSIVVTNPWPFDIKVSEVVDSLQGFGSMPLDCTADGSTAQWPVELFQDEQVVCTFSTKLPDKTLRLNSVTASTTMDSVVSGTSTIVPVLFKDTNRRNNCVHLQDSQEKLTEAKRCATTTVQYWRTIHADQCGSHKTIHSEATLIPTDAIDGTPQIATSEVTVTTEACAPETPESVLQSVSIRK
ncbi:MAG: hypothetical protein JXX29_14955 [Deltaproteobacteria bacterium]|nr:hypothetical protein [Deltaproteobacteria bacterium]MBN2672979.1 hypothetical protein [Deltaproteobacteria bacterium]